MPTAEKIVFSSPARFQRASTQRLQLHAWRSREVNMPGDMGKSGRGMDLDCVRRASPRTLGVCVAALLLVGFWVSQTRSQMAWLEESVLKLQSEQRRTLGSSYSTSAAREPASRGLSGSSGSGWDVEGLPMSIRLGARVHMDNGVDGDEWTTIRSPAPVPPPVPAKKRRKSMYGGSREAAHVGGFLQNDTQSYEPRIWEFMTQVMGVRSVLDIGCGRGISTKWFMDHGCRVQCAEGTSEGVESTVLPSRDLIVQHDYTQGPWWPTKTFDAVWACEFLEHVGEKYMDNWLASMRSAHYVFTSHSMWGGHHHVAIHHDWWWIEKFESRGYQYLPEVTDIVRRLSMTSGNYMKATALVFRNTRNVKVAPMLGPGTGGQQCAETIRLLKGTRLLRAACDRHTWYKGRNPIIPWVSKCKDVCKHL